jgi:Nucleotidyl transferase AbiEii toxin, Type IV TA system
VYGSFNPPQGPAKSAQRKDLLFLFFAQDIHRRRIILRLSQCPGSAIPLAAFQVSTDGRFWVSAEDFVDRASIRDVLGLKLPVAPVEDVLQGKIWAALHPERRPTKRKKDLLDIERLLESYPALRVRVPENILSQLG